MAVEDLTFHSKAERQARVVKLHGEGLSQTTISTLLSISRSTVLRDCGELELKSWSNVSDADLKRALVEILQREHTGTGYIVVESHLIKRYGLRVQERRIRAGLVRAASPNL